MRTTTENDLLMVSIYQCLRWCGSWKHRATVKKACCSGSRARRKTHSAS